MTERNRTAAPVHALEARIGVLEEEKRLLEEALRRTTAELERCIDERREYLESYVGAQQQNATLMNLYVASRRLHSSVKRDEILEALQEIIVNLVGSEELVILERDGESGLHVASSFGVNTNRWAGARVVEDCVRSGETHVGARGDEITACIPLKVGGHVFGVIVIFGLLGQKDGLTDVDRELFELLATHAGLALYSSSLHAAHQEAR